MPPRRLALLRSIGGLLLAAVLDPALWAVQPPPESPPPSAVTQEPDPLPAAAEIAERQKAAEANLELSEADRTALVDAYKQIQSQLKRLADAENRRKRLVESADAASTELRKAREQQAKPETDGLPTPPPPWSSLSQLQQFKENLAAALLTAKTQRQAIETTVRERAERAPTLAQLQATVTTEADGLLSELPANEQEPAELTELRRIGRRAQRQAAQAELKLFQQEQRTYDAEVELLPMQAALLKRREQAIESQLNALSQRISQSRAFQVSGMIESLEALAETDERKTLERGMAYEPPPTLAWLNEWPRLVQLKAEAEAQVLRKQQQFAELNDSLKNTRQQVAQEKASTTGLSSWMGLMLTQRRSTLPKISEESAELRARALQIDKIQQLLSDAELRLAQLGPPIPDENEARFAEREALEGMITDARSAIYDLSRLSQEQQATINTITEYQSLIDANVLWIRSVAPLQIADLGQAWLGFQSLVAPERLHALRDAFAGLNRQPLVLAALAFVLVLLGLGAKIRRQIVTLGMEANKRSCTTLRPTLQTAILSFALASTFPLLLLVLGYGIAQGSVLGFAHAMIRLGWTILPIEALRQIMRPGGLAVQHFGWSKEAAESIRRSLTWGMDLIAPLMFLWALVSEVVVQEQNRQIGNTLGRFIFLLIMLVSTLVLWHLLHPRHGAPRVYLQLHRGGWLDRLQYVWHPLISLTPLALAGLAIAGYYYSASQLARPVYRTLLFYIAGLLAGGFLQRWLMLNRRSLALAQLRQPSGQRMELSEVPNLLLAEEPSADLTQLNQQSLRLMNVILWVIVLVGVAYLWAPVLPAVQWLDQFQLGGSETNPVTLADLLLALPVIMLSIVVVRNLPGLLETLLLQHLPLENAVRYAIRSLCTYALGAIGVVLTARTLGLQWQSIQWLVAALGVGLGFGLQEIVANFISGIIVLFEQPIRVGDVITMDGSTGVVTRIRMRATTVTNWDHQELIIPNKDLITGRLLNWTLSDSINRVVLNVGIAYSADAERACTLLREIIREYKQIVPEPEPTVTFEQLGDSSLVIVVRAFLKSLDERLPTIHALNTTIHRRFREEGIEIPFPQRDLHLRSIPDELVGLLRGTARVDRRDG
jgi:potassium efflux system protein